MIILCAVLNTIVLKYENVEKLFKILIFNNKFKQL